jgi:hypothetical protein
MKPPGSEAHLNRAAPNPGVKQLPPPHHAVLPTRKPRNDTIHITRPAFAPYGVVNAGLVGHAADVGGGRRAGGTPNFKSLQRK